MAKIAINGLGRIGRPLFKIILKHFPDLEIVAINDLADPKVLAHLLKYDSVYGIYDKSIKASDESIFVDGTKEGRQVKVFAERNPENLPWKELGIDIVLECTGVFRHYEGAEKHLKVGAKKVIISAPAKDPDKIPSFVLGVNNEQLDINRYDIVDMGSCTTNCLAPVVKVLHDNFGIVRGFMSTIHSYTNDQRILDLYHKDVRRARAAAINIIPTTTGAAKALAKVIPELKGKLDGMAFRVPTPTVSVIDLVCLLEKEATAEEINYVFKKASQEESLKGILGIEDAQLVSSDYKGNTFSAVVDASLTKGIGNICQVVAWYDNEWAYANRLAEFTHFVSQKMGL